MRLPVLVDIALPGWAPFYGINLSEDMPGDPVAWSAGECALSPFPVSD